MKTLNINREINLAEHSKFLKRLLLILINKIGKIIHKIHIHNFHVRIMINRLESRSENNLLVTIVIMSIILCSQIKSSVYITVYYKVHQ